uniref:Cadherin domain-containing protein n=1 Tax=Biomphalaria glabrata TaxID=6526 RepID=A0A2C9JDZ0_BIOGL
MKVEKSHTHSHNMNDFSGYLFATVVIWLVLSRQASAQETAQVSFIFQEEQSAGTFVGNVALASKLTDKVTQDVFSKLDFTISTNNYFVISPRNGSMTSKTEIDRESECPDKEVCILSADITVYQIDNAGQVNLYMFIKVNVTIEDINDNAPRFAPNMISLDTPEGNVIGDVLYIQPANDPDYGKNSVAQYSFQDPSNTFELIPKDSSGLPFLSLVMKKVLDRETRDFYQVTVIATDGGFPRRTGSVVINITVTDINDNAPEFVQSSYNESVLESIKPNVPIMKVSATDKDIGKNADITYQFSSRVSDKVRNTFYIDQKTGEIFAKTTIDYETDKQFQITVEAVDNGATQLTARTSVTLNVVDVNDNAPEINVNMPATGADILESVPVGTFISYISVNDKDSGENGVVVCDMNDDHFSLDKLDFTRYKVTLAQPLDYEVKHSYTVTIICRDGGQPTMSSSAVFVVNVVDVNDNRPIFTEATYFGNVMENQRVAVPILTVTAHDFDSGEYGRVTYTIEDAYSRVFSMDPNSGQLLLIDQLDREKTPRFEFYVIARDNGPGRLSSSAIIIIVVNDEDDNPPTFLSPIYFGYVLENQPAGTVVGNATAVDIDTPENSLMSYSFLPFGDDYQSFSINPSNGIIRTKEVFDREVKFQYQMVIRVTDTRKPEFSSTCNFTVIILDDNDHSPVIQMSSEENTTFVIQYNSSVGTIITTILATDGDDPNSQNSQIQYYIELGDPDHLFNLNSFTGTLTLERIIRAQDIKSYHLVIKAQDNGDPPRVDTRQIIISINGTFPPTAEAGLTTNILIVVILVGVTVVLGVAIGVAICLVRKIDRERRRNLEAQKNTEDKMYQVKEQDVYKNIGVDGEIEDSNSNNLSKRNNKKEVSFSIEEETDSHNTSTGSSHPLTSFKGGTDRSQTHSTNRPANSSNKLVTNGGMNIPVSQCCHSNQEKQINLKRTPQDEEIRLMELLKRNGEDALSESSGNSDPSDSGRGGSEDDSSHRGSGLDPARAKLLAPGNYKNHAVVARQGDL